MMEPRTRRVREDDMEPELVHVPCHRIEAVLNSKESDAVKLEKIRQLIDAAHSEIVRAGESISRADFARRLYRGVPRE